MNGIGACGQLQARGNGTETVSPQFLKTESIEEMKMQTRQHLLVIGYGNTLRCDDGVGPRVAEAVGALYLPGVRTLICQQLSPEHAEPISQARTVIFVDAAVDAPGEVQFRKLEPNDSPQLMAHAADPRTMLALARDVFGHAPEAWWLTIPAVNLEFGEVFSLETESGFHEALRHIQSLSEQFCRANDKKCEVVANFR
jgi:hydrogenase maturation protease